ncbi:MAG: NAD(P)H-dependent glycerol-3-phosphate dehydrogenase [Gemmatimonadota bacterium]
MSGSLLPGGVRAAVVGAGSWGTALAHLLHTNGHRVSLWSYEDDVVRTIREDGENRAYLPGVKIPRAIHVSRRLEEVVPDAQVVVSVSPAQHVDDVMRKAAAHLAPGALVVSASKGIETTTLRCMHEVLAEFLPARSAENLVALSGPSFAVEVARGSPTAVVAASRSEEARLTVQKVFGSETFRVYTNADLIGVEVGGAVKNVIALAAGVCAGLEFGHNTEAALITRGLAEIARLATALGGQPATIYGLAGLGDLVLTCTGGLSRNRTVGIRLGRGERISEILGDMRSVAEGVSTTVAVHALARERGVEMPIVDQVYAILEEGKPPREAVQELMLREPKPET